MIRPIFSGHAFSGVVGVVVTCSADSGPPQVLGEVRSQLKGEKGK